jgi:WD40 repeat protein
MSHIFISHSSRDDDFITRLAADLRAAGLQTFVDHEDIQPSQDWDATVQAALESTDVMVLVLSPRSVASQNVKVEWSFFLDLGKPIYPILLEDCEIPFRLRLFQYVNFTQGDDHKATKQLLAALVGRKRARKASSKKPTAEQPRITPGNVRRVDALLVLSGHRDTVRAVAFSADGQMIASGSDDKNVRLWYTLRRTRIKTLIGHEKPVTAVDFSPDGARLASASEDRTIRLWDVAKRFCLTALAGHTAGVNGVAFGPAGSLLASASDDSTVRLWDAASRKPVCTLGAHDGPASDVAFSPDGSLLVSGGIDRCVRLWAVAERRELAALDVPDAVRRLAFSPDGSLLAVALDGGGVTLMNVAKREKIGAIHYADYNANCARGVAFSPDGVLLAVASLDGNLRLWKVTHIGTQNRALRVLGGHEGGVMDVHFSPGGRVLASGSHDQTLRLWGVS